MTDTLQDVANKIETILYNLGDYEKDGCFYRFTDRVTYLPKEEAIVIRTDRDYIDVNFYEPLKYDTLIDSDLWCKINIHGGCCPVLTSKENIKRIEEMLLFSERYKNEDNFYSKKI